jgi:nitrile hydratase accessory protein
VTLPPLDLLPRIPRDADGPIFRKPWEAQVFALAVHLHRQGAFTWPHWASTLADAIKHAQSRGDADLGDSYYRHWLAALERLLIAKGIASTAMIEARAASYATTHDH